MFEYTSYRVMVVLAAVWFLWVSLRPAAGRRPPNLAPFMAFLVGCLATALPVFVDITHNQGDAIFFEAFRRHGAERREPLSAATIQHITRYGAALFGARSSAGPSLAPPGEPAVPPLAGFLFGAATVSAAFSRRRLLRALAVTVVLTAVAAALTANNALPGRLSPLLVLLLVMVGALLDQGSRLGGSAWARWSPRFGRHSHPPGEEVGRATSGRFAPMRPGTPELLLGPVPFVLGALAVVIVTLNALAVRRMANAREVIRDYCKDDYATAYWIGRLARLGQTVVVVTPDTGEGWLPKTDMNWLFASKNPTIRGFGSFPPAESLPDGALVVVGVRGRSLEDSEIRPLERLATALRVGRVQLHENAAHSVSVASIELPPKGPL